MSDESDSSIEHNLQSENSCNSVNDRDSYEEKIKNFVSSLHVISQKKCNEKSEIIEKSFLVNKGENSFMDQDQSSITEYNFSSVMQQDNLSFDKQYVYIDYDENINCLDETESVPKNFVSDYSDKEFNEVSKQSKVHKLICPYCSKCFKTLRSKLNHVNAIHKIRQSYIACQDCNVYCKDVEKLQQHYKHMHNKQLDTSLLNDKYSLSDASLLNGVKGKTSVARVKCIECNITFGLIQTFREHLTACHQLEMIVQELHFPNMTAFKKWKLEIERKNLVHYYTPHGAKKISTGIRRLYTCHRSGIYIHQAKSNRNRVTNFSGSRKTGVMCTSEIICYEHPNEVFVKYCPNHYGHGKDTPYRQLSVEEQTAIQENVSKGISFQEQVNDIKNSHSEADHYRAGVIKKRDMRIIDKAFAAEIYETGMTEAESVEQWVQQCCEVGAFAVVYYQPESSNTKDKDFMLTIMTEYQKYILVASSKQVVCINSYFRMKGCPDYLTVLFVMDEYNVAFPVAFCFSGKRNKNVILKFLLSIKKVTGPLSCTYLMSGNENLYYEAWQEAMSDESIWVWSIWSVDNDFQVHLRRLLKNIPKRAGVYRTLRRLLECNNKPVFTTMFMNFIASLLKEADTKSFGEFLQHKYSSNTERWACCYRKEIKLSTNIYLESLHHTILYCSRMIGKKELKHYRMKKLLLVLMKWLRYKMLDRFTSLEDEERMTLAKNNISSCHELGLEISSDTITSLSDKTWLILSEEVEDKVYVTRDFESCPELCDLKCSACDVCVHMFSCTCLQSLVNANMCPHIHAVVWKFLPPDVSLPSSPILENFHEDLVIPNKCPELLESILKRMDDLSQKVTENKCKLNQDALSEVLKMLNRCHDICSGKKLINADNLSNNSYDSETGSDSRTTKTIESSVLSSYHNLNVSKTFTNDVISQKHQKIKAATPASKKAYFLKAIIRPSSSSDILNSPPKTNSTPYVLHVIPDELKIENINFLSKGNS
ncbi:uncharacterized protein NPIL_419901 [Nephila pilipes]|uniref:C2H2-type domain-containing protein n=1 Tax=Nephila pilipes TaxID=299642 RepID=A0A8X6MJX1_NEPPI|nr:uncharacterized protein NPIL_419901 [Nephila pilipes]